MFSDQQVNLHTHTELCGHAYGSPEEFCKVAVEHGYKVLGFSDHAPFHNGKIVDPRMTLNDLPLYGELMDRAQRSVSELTVLRGFELDYIEDMGPYQEFRRKLHLDYMLGSAHRAVYKGTEYIFFAQDPIDAEVFCAFAQENLNMLKSGVIDILAHPDCAAARYSGELTPELAELFREIVRESVKRNIPLELNVNGTNGHGVAAGRWRYPWRPFWEIAAESKAKVIVSIDAHRPERLYQETISKVYDFAAELDLHIVNAEFAEMLIERRKQNG